MVSRQGRFSGKGTRTVELVTLPLFFAFFRLHNPKKVNCETTDAPPRIVADDQLTTDTAPLGRWDCDVLEAEGAARLKALVYEIHRACAQLDPGERLFFGYSHESRMPLEGTD